MTQGLFTLWTHALAAALYAAITVWQLRRSSGDPLKRPLVTVFGVIAVWSVFLSLAGPQHFLSLFAESARNLALLAFLSLLIRAAEDDPAARAVKPVHATVAGVVILQIVVAGLSGQFLGAPGIRSVLAPAGSLLGLSIAAGLLVLVHNLYGRAASRSRRSIRLPMIGLAVILAFDLHLYTVAFLMPPGAGDLFALRGLVLAAAVPLFLAAGKMASGWKVQLSHGAAGAGISIVAILAYLLLMISLSKVIALVGDEWTGFAQLTLILALTLGAFLFLPAERLRAWLKVVTAKHFFEHRYDYREEWLRFTRTVAMAGEEEAPLEQRMVQALAETADCPWGLLLIADEDQRLVPSAVWNCEFPAPADHDADGAFIRMLSLNRRIVDLGADPAPSWIGDLGAWAGVPLIHNDRLLGFAVLAHPLVRRQLDWEDLDLFRTTGMQAASYLAEAQGQEALSDARRFDEFNRRFAFIMHDIKNVVSQLTLVSRNAERHADNPEFRTDMVGTLQASAKKMNDLLAKISRDQQSGAEAPRPVDLHRIVLTVASAKSGAHPVEASGATDVAALADPARLEQALLHLVQNAIDASREDVPVRVEWAMRGNEIAIEVIDQGCGMSPEFVRTRLFQPFTSTKTGGFGVGALEARTLVAGMGGRLAVDSREGEGTRFTIFLPPADAPAADNERMSA
jgi:putative PEP-CTERM system histidine kinase